MWTNSFDTGRSVLICLHTFQLALVDSQAFLNPDQLSWLYVKLKREIIKQPAEAEHASWTQGLGESFIFNPS